MNNKSIFDTLPTMPEGAEAAGDADTERIRELVHKGLEKYSDVHHNRKRLRLVPLLIAAAVAVTLVSVGAVACAKTYVSPEEAAKKMLKEEYNERREYYKNHLEEVSNPTDLSFDEMDIITKAMLIRDKIREEEQGKISEILKKYDMNEHLNVCSYNHTDWSIEEYDEFFSMIIDCCKLYRSDDITVEEKMRLFNYIDHCYTDYSINFGFTNLSSEYKGYNNEAVRVVYPESYELWVEAFDRSSKILKENSKH